MINQINPFPKLVFLKLGGSLITDKGRPHTPRTDVIVRLLEEISFTLDNDDELHLVLGHGSGSFGHIPANKFGTAQGVNTPEEWHGFTKVWFEARLLNQIIIEKSHEIGLPFVSFPISTSGTAQERLIHTWDLTSIRSALESKLIPVVYGDVIFDSILGGTIVSTEDIFAYIARELSPVRILLVGKDEGVYADYPKCTQLIPEINSSNWESVTGSLDISENTDVTGGMRSKVKTMVTLISEMPDLEVYIFSGDKRGNIISACRGGQTGTRISS